jgi:RES domain-containing protein
MGFVFGVSTLEDGMRNTEIAPIERAKQVLSFDETKAKLAELAVQSERIVEITNPAGYQEAQREADRIARQEAEAKAKAEREARAAAEQERIAMVIANATLAESARDAVELLEDSGLGEHLVTRKLRAAVERNLSTTECAA